MVFRKQKFKLLRTFPGECNTGRSFSTTVGMRVGLNSAWNSFFFFTAVHVYRCLQKENDGPSPMFAKCWDKGVKKTKTVATSSYAQKTETKAVATSAHAQETESRLLQAGGKPPDNVTKFINGTFRKLMAEHQKDEEHTRLIYKQVAEWSVCAIQASAHSAKVKHWSRLLLGSRNFVLFMSWAGVYRSPFRSELQKYLQQTGKPLRQFFDQEVGGNYHFTVENYDIDSLCD